MANNGVCIEGWCKDITTIQSLSSKFNCKFLVNIRFYHVKKVAVYGTLWVETLYLGRFHQFKYPQSFHSTKENFSSFDFSNFTMCSSPEANVFGSWSKV